MDTISFGYLFLAIVAVLAVVSFAETRRMTHLELICNNNNTASIYAVRSFLSLETFSLELVGFATLLYVSTALNRCGWISPGRGSRSSELRVINLVRNFSPLDTFSLEPVRLLVTLLYGSVARAS